MLLITDLQSMVLVLYLSTKPMTWTGYPRLIIGPMLEIRIRKYRNWLVTLKVGCLCNMYILGRGQVQTHQAKHMQASASILGLYSF